MDPKPLDFSTHEKPAYSQFIVSGLRNYFRVYIKVLLKVLRIPHSLVFIRIKFDMASTLTKVYSASVFFFFLSCKCLFGGSLVMDKCHNFLVQSSKQYTIISALGLGHLREFRITNYPNLIHRC